ncbi:MAG: hypothetical protein WDN46_08775 [Methylocella sp.]
MTDYAKTTRPDEFNVGDERTDKELREIARAIYGDDVGIPPNAAVCRGPAGTWVEAFAFIPVLPKKPEPDKWSRVVYKKKLFTGPDGKLHTTVVKKKLTNKIP